MKRQWGNDFQQKATNFMWQQQRYPVALLFPTTSPRLLDYQLLIRSLGN